MWKFIFKGRMSAGQTGHMPGQMAHVHVDMEVLKAISLAIIAFGAFEFIVPKY